MKETLLATLRNRNIGPAEFRNAANALMIQLAQDAKEQIPEIQNPVLVPILRSGVAFLPSFLEQFSQARVGFLGLARDEETAMAHWYYEKMPEIHTQDIIIVVDPMIATGGTGVQAVEKIISLGATEKNIFFFALITAPEGVTALQERFPDMTVTYLMQDKGLDPNHMIVPGIGDFGDRYFANV